MKKTKNLFFIALAVLIISVMFCFNASALEATGQCGENVTWSFDSETGELVISGTGNMYSECFYGCKEVTSVVIEEGVTSVGYLAFGELTNLENVTLAESITMINDGAFYGCVSLESITIPEAVTYMGDAAFSKCHSLNNVELNGSFSSLYSDTFGDCIYLEEIIIPENVSSISKDVFINCIRLEKITVENPDCFIRNDFGTFPEAATLYGYEGSTLQTYAENWNRKFVLIGSEEGGEGEVTPDTPADPHQHIYPEEWTTLSVASCSQEGIAIRLCEGCNIFETQRTPAYGHSDEDKDGKCDECKVVLENTTPSPEEPTKPSKPSEEKEQANVFSFLTEFLSKLIDFLKGLFSIK